jgi:hypothetical protein
MAWPSRSNKAMRRGARRGLLSLWPLFYARPMMPIVLRKNKSFRSVTISA